MNSTDIRDLADEIWTKVDVVSSFEQNDDPDSILDSIVDEAGRLGLTADLTEDEIDELFAELQLHILEGLN